MLQEVFKITVSSISHLIAFIVLIIDMAFLSDFVFGKKNIIDCLVESELKLT